MIETLPFPAIFDGRETDTGPSWYIYQVEKDQHQYSGLVCAISLADTQNGFILGHEQVFHDKVDGLYREFSQIPIQKNPILLITDESAFKQKLQEMTLQVTLIKEVKAANGSIHRISKIPISSEIKKFTQSLCVADGHHRLSALSQLKKKKAMVAIFSADQVITRTKSIVLQIKDNQFWEILHEIFDVFPISEPTSPTEDHQFTMLFQNRWYQLSLKPSYLKQKNFQYLLGIEIFRETVLQPIFQIPSYTNTSTAQFLFEECSIRSLTQRIGENGGVGFIVSSDPFIKVIEAARRSRILEPNSTYFEPKLMSGLISFQLDHEYDN